MWSPAAEGHTLQAVPIANAATSIESQAELSRESLSATTNTRRATARASLLKGAEKKGGKKRRGEGGGGVCTTALRHYNTTALHLYDKDIDADRSGGRGLSRKKKLHSAPAIRPVSSIVEPR